MHIDLFVFDLDGTALGGYEPYERLPDRFSAFLDELHDQGVRWCTNTTWHPAKQAEMIEASAVRSRPELMFGATGLMKARYGGGAVFDEAWERRKQEIDRRFRDEVWPAIQQSCELVPEQEERLMQHLIGPPPPAELLESLGVQHLDGVLLPVEMCKGHALREIQRDLGCDPARTLVAGDAANDLPMFSVDLAAYQACPSNAEPPVAAKVTANGGIQGDAPFSDGVMDAARRLLH